MAETVLDIVAEDPQVEHVAPDVKPTRMQEHGGRPGTKAHLRMKGSPPCSS